MGLVSFLLTLPVLGPLKGVSFVAGKLAEQALEEMLDESRIHQELIELEFRRDLGDIGDDEFAAKEEALLERLEAIRKYREEQEAGRPEP